jgi:hypothetical protein
MAWPLNSRFVPYPSVTKWLLPVAGNSPGTGCHQSYSRACGDFIDLQHFPAQAERALEAGTYTGLWRYM